MVVIPLAVKYRSAFAVALVDVWRKFARVLATGLILSGFLVFYCARVPATPQVQSPDAIGAAEQLLFIRGQHLYNQGLYNEAIAVFGDFLKAYPHSQIEDLTVLWLGRSHMRIGDLAGAEQIGSRMRAIPDTSFVSIYEEELRVARRTYIKPATPSIALESLATVRSLKVVAEDPKLPASTTSPQRTTPHSFSVLGQPTNETAKAQPAVVGPHTPIIEKYKPVGGEAAKVSLALGPLVRIRMEQSLRESAVTGASFYRLVVVNEGKGIAKDLVVSELLSDDSQFASSDPAPSRQESVGRTQRLTFRIAELKPGESRTLRIAVRPRAGAQPENHLKAKHSVTYQDSLNKSYHSE
jgi:Domain of unknown function DUF11